MRKRSLTWLNLILTLVLLGTPLWAQTSTDTNNGNTRPRRAVVGGVNLSMDDVKSYERAIVYNQRLAVGAPYAFDSYYNVASLYALLGQKRDALEWLRRAVDKGLVDDEMISADTSLISLRDEPVFKQILTSIPEKAAKLPKIDKTIIEIVGPSGPTAKGPLPMLIALHGETESAFGMIDIMRVIAERHSLVLVAPQGKYFIGDGHYQWGRRNEAEALVMQAIEQAKGKYSIDPNRIYLMGFSQGGYLSLTLGLSHPEIFAGAIAFSGRYLHSLVTATLEKARNRKFRVFIGNGERESPHILNNNNEAKQLLEQAGLTVNLKIFAETGHAYPPNATQEIDEAVQWLIRQ
ncbi:MAG: alpha/beta hydrolase-fold protein [Acidobacteriota bacterium]